MQEAKDKMQWPDSMPAMWNLVLGVLLRTQLLYHQLQRLRVSEQLTARETKSDLRGSEFQIMNSNIRSLQEQVDNLYSTINTLRNTPATIGISYHRHGSHPPQPHLAQSSPRTVYQGSMPSSQLREKHLRFQGPTSTAFNFDVANSSLQNMGITDVKIPDDLGVTADGSLYKSSVQHRPGPGTVMVPPSDDPLWKVRKDEAIRLCQVYEEEIGIMFPMLDMEHMILKANLLYSFESTPQPDLANHLSSLVSLDTDDTNILKMILATSLTLEGSGESELGKMLFESTRGACEMRLWDPVDIKGLILLVIVVWFGLVFSAEER